MAFLPILLLLAALAAGIWYWRGRRAFARLFSMPLSQRRRAIVARQVPLVRKLPAELRDRLEGRINAFLHQVRFIGCDGLEVDEEMELSIAAQACLLVVNNDAWYRDLRTILIYPGPFRSRQQEYDGYVVTERSTVRTGESWARGPVVLSWAHSRQGALEEADGHNVVLHEFAHQFDELTGHADGIPLLGKDQSLAEWAQVFGEAYRRLVHKVERGRETVIDPYGAEGPGEFFAVSVEMFFERPEELRADEPGVYAELSKLFRLDPASWR